MDLFDFEDYRAYLNELVQQNKGTWGYKSLLAKKAGCQPSFLTQVLKGKANLTTDQALGICDFICFSDEETDYFLEVVQIEKAGTEKLRNYLKRKIQKRREEREDLSKKYSKDRLAENQSEMLYYSSWYWSAIHIFTGITNKTDSLAISQHFNLPIKVVEEMLIQLEEMSLLQRSKNGEWSVTQSSVHLPKHSVMSLMNHTNWRNRALVDIQSANDESVHYTALQSISKKDFARLRTMLKKMIETSREVVKETEKKEQTVCLLCDLFPV